MKIVSIHFGLSLGGVAKYAATLERVREFVPVELRSLCLLPAGRIVDEAALAALDARVIRLHSRTSPAWIRQARAVIATEAPDCILSHGFNGHLVSLLCAGAAVRPVTRLATYHGSYHATTASGRLVEPVYNGFTHWFMRNRVKSVLNVAQYCADYLAGKGVDPGRLAVVHNGIPDYQAPASRRAELRAEWGFDDRHRLLGVASRLDPVKGLEYLVDAMGGVAQDFPDARLVIMGEGTVRAELESQADRLGIRDRVLFAGMRTDIPDCLAALDLFVLPSLAEYHSIGLLEAMRAGLPIVATAVGGNTESVREGVDGLIVKPADADGLGAAIARLLGDRDCAARLAASARQRFLEEFTEHAMLVKTAAWLRSVCGA